MTYPFLSTAWMDAAREIREKYADQAAKVTVSIKMNQVITDVPAEVGADAIIKAFMDTSSGEVVMDLGELETADLTVTVDYETARKIFVEQDQAAGMQAFMSGKIKVEGDITKLMAMQNAAPDPTAAEIANKIKDITTA